MKRLVLATAIASLALPAGPALANPPYWAPAHGYRNNHGDIAYRRTDNGIRYWRGQDGR